jgi:hypothetical protein
MMGFLVSLLVLPIARDTTRCNVHLLPAYSHNDYLNPRPLLDALELGFRGAEVDVFRVGTDLLVSHDRRRLDASRTLRQLYFEPLRERQRSCGFVLHDSSSFYLNVELKQADSLALQMLLEQLSQYPELVGSSSGDAPGVQLTLVGWWPNESQLRKWPDYVRVQIEIGDHSTAMDPILAARAGLVSLDYRKVLNWPLTSAALPTADPILRVAQDIAATLDAPIRVHHAPVDGRLYRTLLDQGVTLIGAGNLRNVHALLARMTSHSSH